MQWEGRAPRLRAMATFGTGALLAAVVHYCVADRRLHGPDIFLATYHKTGTVLYRAGWFRTENLRP